MSKTRLVLISFEASILLSGGRAESVTQSSLKRGVVGTTRIEEATERPVGIGLSDKLPDTQLLKVYAHENSHVLDQLVG